MGRATKRGNKRTAGWVARLPGAELMTRRRAILAGIVAIAALALVLAAVSAQRTTNAASVSAGASEAADSYAAPVRLTSIDGKQVTLPAGRPGMVMLSSSLCTTCFLTVRDMGKLKARLGGRVDAAFISVDPGDSATTLADRRDSIGDPPIPFAIDTTGTLAERYQITTLGTVVVYDAAGRIVDRWIEPTLSDLEAAFRRVDV
jgi:cytochrome oxidase Cu insertion factor (SCO1/SenC/PrrC family)